MTGIMKKAASLGMASVFAAGACIPAYAAGTGTETQESVQAPGGGRKGLPHHP